MVSVLRVLARTRSLYGAADELVSRCSYKAAHTLTHWPVLRLIFQSLRSLEVSGLHRARLHGCGEHVVDLGPGGANLRREGLTEAALERPKQRFTDEQIMFRRHAVARMAHPKRFHCWDELV